MFIENGEQLLFSPVNQRQIRVWYLALIHGTKDDPNGFIPKLTYKVRFPNQ